jgi:uncharacterized repeat protein (TIGR01451 family)
MNVRRNSLAVRAALAAAAVAIACAALPATAAAAAAVRVVFGSSPGSLDQGKRGAYKIRVENAGPDTATGVVLRYSLPPQLRQEYVRATQGSCADGVCSFGTVAPGRAATAAPFVTALTPGRATLNAVVTHQQADTNPADNQASFTSTILADRRAPTPANFRLSRYVFRSTSRGIAPRGTAIRFDLAEPAEAVFTVRQLLVGRRVGDECRRTTRRNRRRRACTYVRRIGSFSRGLRATEYSLAFSGRMRIRGRVRSLARGNYHLTVVATDRVGNASRPRTRGFRIVR